MTLHISIDFRIIRLARIRVEFETPASRGLEGNVAYTGRARLAACGRCGGSRPMGLLSVAYVRV
jgi:hypothetical protein